MCLCVWKEEGGTGRKGFVVEGGGLEDDIWKTRRRRRHLSVCLSVSLSVCPSVPWTVGALIKYFCSQPALARRAEEAGKEGKKDCDGMVIENLCYSPSTGTKCTSHGYFDDKEIKKAAKKKKFFFMKMKIISPGESITVLANTHPYFTMCKGQNKKKKNKAISSV